MKQSNFHIRGIAPLLCHSDRGSDPLDPLKKEQAKITSKRKKSEDDHLEISRLDWYLGLYQKDGIPIMPCWNIFACLRDAAKLSRSGTAVTRAIIMEAESVPILYDGPKNIEALWEDGRFMHRCSVGNQKARVMRTRPMFQQWELKFSLMFDESVFDEGQVAGFVETAGRYIGLGDFRPRFGRFEVI